MEWMPRLVGMGIDRQSRSFDVMAVSRPEGLGDLAALGLTLAEAKQLVVRVQQDVIAAQTGNQTVLLNDKIAMPDCACLIGTHACRPHPG
jgi:hypothetical protein